MPLSCCFRGLVASGPRSRRADTTAEIHGCRGLLAARDFRGLPRLGAVPSRSEPLPDFSRRCHTFAIRGVGHVGREVAYVNDSDGSVHGAISEHCGPVCFWLIVGFPGRARSRLGGHVTPPSSSASPHRVVLTSRTFRSSLKLNLACFRTRGLIRERSPYYKAPGHGPTRVSCSILAAAMDPSQSPSRCERPTVSCGPLTSTIAQSRVRSATSRVWACRTWWCALHAHCPTLFGSPGSTRIRQRTSNLRRSWSSRQGCSDAQSPSSGVPSARGRACSAA